jgi:hypothetical protein
MIRGSAQDRLRTNIFALLLSVGAAFVFSLGARAATFSEDAIKAAYLHRFAAYVEWPADAAADGTFTIGVFGSGEVAAQLEMLLPTLTLHGLPAQVRAVSGPADLKSVAILYVGRGQLNRARTLIRAARDGPVLLVTNDPEGLRQGAAINFVEAGRNVRFEVSLTATDRSRLKVSSALLAVASRVEGRE